MSLDSNKGMMVFWNLLLVSLLSVVLLACDKFPTDSENHNQWVAINNGLESLYIHFLIVHPSNSKVLFAGTWDGLYKSANGGQIWARVDSGWTYTQMDVIAFDALDADVMYVGTKGGGVYKSEDDGESWKKRNVGLIDLTIYGIATDPNHSDTLFMSCEKGIYRSFDGADTSWTNVDWLPRAFLAIDPQNSQLVYAGGKWNNFRKSGDGGETWASSAEGISPGGPSIRIPWVLIDPVDPSILYVASNNGIYKSTNFAGNWTDANEGLRNRDVKVIVLDFSNTDLIYTATAGGVFRSGNAAGTWEEMNEGLTNLDVEALAMGSVHPRTLYAGTWGEGVFKWID